MWKEKGHAFTQQWIDDDDSGFKLIRFIDQINYNIYKQIREREVRDYFRSLLAYETSFNIFYNSLGDC